MQLTIDQSINLALDREYHRHSQCFIAQAISEWDRVGKGCFPRFIQLYLYHCWYEMTQSN